jgi:fucose permease
MAGSSNNLPKVLAVYGSGLLLGLTMVSFPASSTYLKSHGLTDAQYGFLFIPQLVAAIIGSLLGGAMAKKVGLIKLMIFTLLFIGASQLFFFFSVENLENPELALALYACTALFGFAFGLSAAPINNFPGQLFPDKSESALVALHTILGLGLAIGPVLVSPLISHAMWWLYPVLLVGIAVLLIVVTLSAGLPDTRAQAEQAQEKDDNIFSSSALWLFVVIAVLYSFAEGTFSNWSVVFLNEQKGIELGYASLALSVFWASMAGGRLVASIILLKVPGKVLWIILPVMIVLSFFIIPQANSAFTGILFFALAGLSCSAFFPITMDLTTKYFTQNQALASSVMTAALMFGVGVGSYMIGALRSLFDLDNLYRISAIYPGLVFVLGMVMIRTFLNQKSEKPK